MSLRGTANRYNKIKIRTDCIDLGLIIFMLFRKKKTNRLGSNVDYSRSISVPADKVRSTAQKKISEPCLPGNLPSSPEIE